MISKEEIYFQKSEFDFAGQGGVLEDPAGYVGGPGELV